MSLVGVLQFLQNQNQILQGKAQVVRQTLELLGPAAASITDFLALLEEQDPWLFKWVCGTESKWSSYQKEVDQACKAGVCFLRIGEDLYPDGFFALSDPPFTVQFLGDPVWKRQLLLSVVGSREPSYETSRWMEFKFSDFLANTKTAVVSGGARGVDQLAHRICLRHKAPTVAILPSGLSKIYPHHFQQWVEPICERGGAILSEYPFGASMAKWNFHHRNRLIAALGFATLVAQARLRSGTMITAQHAAQLGKPVLVIPGHPMDSGYSGSNQLLFEGATLVRDSIDLRQLCRAESILGSNYIQGVELF